ncbi:MAG: translocation/assembly module TamB domain-containing protein [Maricaulaceae bacterium]
MTSETVSQPTPKAKRRWLRRGVLALGVLVGLIVLTLGGLRGLVTSPWGRSLVVDLAQGQSFSGVRLELEGLEGDLLRAARLRRLVLRDEDGVFARVEDVALDWNWRALLRGRVWVDALRVGAVEVDRQPILAPSAAPDPEPPRQALNLPQVMVDGLAIERIALGEAVAGEAVSVSLNGSAETAGARARAALDVVRLDGGEDRLNLEAALSRGEIALTLDAFIGAELAGLIGAPSGVPAQLAVNVAGDVDAGDGAGALRFDETTVADFDLDWSEAMIAAELTATPAGWPALADLIDAFGPQAQARLRLDRTSELARLEAQWGGASMIATSEIDVEAPGAPERARVEAQLTGDTLGKLAPGVQAGRVALNGDLNLGGTPTITATLTVPELVAGDFAAQTVTVDARATATQTAAWRIDATARANGLKPPEGPLVTGLGPAPRLDLAGLVSPDTERVEITSLTASAAQARIEGQGAFGFDLTGQADLRLRVEDVSAWGAPGQGRADLTAQVRARSAEAVAVTLDARLDEFTQWPEDLAAVLGDAGTLTGAVELDGTRLRLDELEARSAAVILDASGRLDGETLEGVRLDLAARPLTLGGLVLDAPAALAVAATGPVSAPEVRLEAQAPELTLSGQRITDLRVMGDLVADGSGGVEGPIRASAETPSGPARLAAQLGLASETIGLSGLDARFAGFSVTGQAQTPMADPLAGSADLAAVYEQGAGGGRARLLYDANQIDLQARAEQLTFGESAIDLGEVRVEGPVSSLALDWRAAGFAGVPFDLAGEGDLALDPTAGQIDLDAKLGGRVAGVDLHTNQPITVAYGPQGVAAALEVVLGENQGVVSAQLVGPLDAWSLEADAEGVEAALLGGFAPEPPLEGAAGARVRAQAGPQGVLGEATLTLDDWSRSDRESATLNGDVRARLEPESGDIAVEIAMSDGLAVQGVVRVPFGETAGDVVPDGALGGRLVADGPLAGLVDLAAGPALTLTGMLKADLAVGGTPSAPELLGEASLGGGQLVHAPSGVLVVIDALDVALDGQQARLVRLEAGDGQDGRLSGDGVLDLAAGGEGELNMAFDRFRFGVPPVLDAQLSGPLSLVFAERAPKAVTGDLVVNRAEIRPPESVGPAPAVTIPVTEINLPDGSSRGPAARPPPIDLDLNVSADRRVFVRGAGLDSEWSLDLAVGGLADAPEVNGELALIRGDLTLGGERFVFDEGVVSFAGDPAAPNLFIVAERRLRALTARITVRGTPEAPVIALSSTPEYPQDEILARALFGRSAAGLSALEAAQLAAALASLSGGGGGVDALGALRGVAGLDRLSVTQEGDGELVVTGGRYITDDVYLEIAGGAASGSERLSVEWTLRPNIALVSRLDGEGDANVAVRWRRDY